MGSEVRGGGQRTSHWEGFVSHYGIPAMGGEPDLRIWHLKAHPSPLSLTPWPGGKGSGGHLGLYAGSQSTATILVYVCL